MGKPCAPDVPYWCSASGRSPPDPSPASAAAPACGSPSSPRGATPQPSAATRKTARPGRVRPSAASTPGQPGPPAPGGNTASSAPPSAAGIAPQPIGRGPPGQPAPGAPTGSWPRPFAKKIPLHRQLANLLIQRSQLRLARLARANRGLVTRKQRRRAVQQRLLPGVNLAGMHTKPAQQLGNRAILPDRRQRHFRLELRTVLLPCIRQVSPPAKPPFQAKTLS